MKTVLPKKTTSYFVWSIVMMMLGIGAISNGINKFDSSVFDSVDSTSVPTSSHSNYEEIQSQVGSSSTGTATTSLTNDSEPLLIDISAYDMLGMTIEEITDICGESYVYTDARDHFKTTYGREMICYGEAENCIMFGFSYYDSKCDMIIIAPGNPITNYIDPGLLVDVSQADFIEMGYDFPIEYDDIMMRYNLWFYWNENEDGNTYQCKCIYPNDYEDSPCTYAELSSCSD